MFYLRQDYRYLLGYGKIFALVPWPARNFKRFFAAADRCEKEEESGLTPGDDDDEATGRQR